ncbi:fimbrial protein [Pantoea coffeiphila]|uniref:Fimbrial protein n=1 Tax=Pantoea coffeiphila TaxID=1465635 RepID=A0A2S9IHM2_9GAMM|nr:fimbrial protein [Pantoea coffeiphila]PRD17282.1 fimbrial protein [Pantoea coffeiphila]
MKMKRLIFLVSMFSCFSHGSTELVGSEINMHGKIVKRPCEINSGKPIEINFNIVNAGKVDGKNYGKPFLLLYDCHGVVMDKMLKYIGNVTSFDKTAVESNIPGFGIALQLNDDGVNQPFNVNSAIRIPASRSFSQLTATPVKGDDKILKAGDFSAAATLEMGYP